MKSSLYLKPVPNFGTLSLVFITSYVAIAITTVIHDVIHCTGMETYAEKPKRAGYVCWRPSSPVLMFSCSSFIVNACVVLIAFCGV